MAKVINLEDSRHEIHRHTQEYPGEINDEIIEPIGPETETKRLMYFLCLTSALIVLIPIVVLLFKYL